MSPLVPYTRQGENFTSSQEPDPSRQSLLYTAHKTICLHHDGKNKEYRIAERPRPVYALALHDNRLVHAEEPARSHYPHEIFYTETNERIAERDGWVKALAVYNGRLVDADAEKIRYTETDEVIAERPNGFIEALVTYKGSLIDATPHLIRHTETGEVIAKSGQDISALADYNGCLVKAEWFVGDRLFLEGRIRYVETGKLIASRAGSVQALAVYKGCLVDGGLYLRIPYTETDQPIVETNNSVFALLPIDDEIADRLLELPGVSPIE
jgi:hypothetical protein